MFVSCAVGYRGKVELQERARELRREGRALADIARELGVSKSSVSLWVRDLGVVIEQRRGGWWSSGGQHPQAVRRHEEIAEMDRLGVARLGELGRQAFLASGAALYAGEGGKTDRMVLFANSDPRMIAFFVAWLREFFEIDEARLRCRLYLHDGLDLGGATRFWADVTGIPEAQFTKPYRATPDATIRHNKHEHGCLRVTYTCSRTHRAVMGLVRALLSSVPNSGVAQLAEQRTVNPFVVGSSPTPGASGFDTNTEPVDPGP